MHEKTSKLIDYSTTEFSSTSNLKPFSVALIPNPIENASQFVQRTLNEWIEHLPIRLIDLDQGVIIKSKSTLMPAIQEALEEQSTEGSFIDHLNATERTQWSSLLTEKLLPHLKYAILSHRWFSSEPDFATASESLPEWLAEDPDYFSSSSSDSSSTTDDLQFRSSSTDPARQKLVTFCKIARSYGYRLAWTDTCCIDKTSSAEYQESINSMFVWYRRSDVCIVHLAETEKHENKALSSTQTRCLYYLRDLKWKLLVSKNNDEEVEWGDKWFSRGWTLQELLAPRVLKFYTSSWEELLPESNNDKTHTRLLQLLAATTKIPEDVVTDFDPNKKISFEKKIRWASGRITTRGEDTTYCLLGIFNLPMAILYGEGSESAFFRFQQEYIRTSDDYSIFKWHGKPSYGNSLLASHPSCFQERDPSRIKSMVWYKNELFWALVSFTGLAWWLNYAQAANIVDAAAIILAYLVRLWDTISAITQIIVFVLSNDDPGRKSLVFVGAVCSWIMVALLVWRFARPFIRPCVSFYEDAFLGFIHKIGMFTIMQPDLGFNLTNVGLRLKTDLYDVWAEQVEDNSSEQVEIHRLMIDRYGYVDIGVKPGEITSENKNSLVAMCFGSNLIILKPAREELNFSVFFGEHFVHALRFLIFQKMTKKDQEPLCKPEFPGLEKPLPVLVDYWLTCLLIMLFDYLNRPKKSALESADVEQSTDITPEIGEGDLLKLKTTSKSPSKEESAAIPLEKEKAAQETLRDNGTTSDMTTGKQADEFRLDTLLWNWLFRPMFIYLLELYGVGEGGPKHNGRVTHIWTKVQTVQGIQSGLSLISVRGSKRLIYIR